MLTGLIIGSAKITCRTACEQASMAWQVLSFVAHSGIGGKLLKNSPIVCLADGNLARSAALGFLLVNTQKPSPPSSHVDVVDSPPKYS